jgi:glycosyltransferase involved in cell wall biosynthesis
MNSEPLVSVLMTSYNREQYIAEAIESVLASTYTNFELIIVDDRSQDKTVEIARSYVAKDDRLQLQINEKNLGDYPNRNEAASLAKGKYIMFCDSDDMFYPDTIVYCVSAMEKNGKAQFGMYYAGPAEQPFLLSPAEVIKKHFFSEPLLNMGPGGTILNRNFFCEINGYPEKYGPANDMYFNLKASSKKDILLLPKLFLHYRIHDGQEKNNLYSYVHYNFRYLDDALKELDLGLSTKNKEYLRNKNSRRFIVNVFNQFKENRNPKMVIDLWNKAGFNIKNLVSGIFH